MWCIPRINKEFTRRLMDLVSLYEKPFDPLLPVVCLDEKPTELHADSRPCFRTQAATYQDYEYVRKGIATVFMMTEPKGGRHYVRVIKRRTRKDFAHTIKWLAAQYPNAVTIHLVMDNLNTHNEKSLIQTFGLKEGRRLWARFSVHYTPVHASWLNQAEIAIGFMAKSCLGKRRMSSIGILRKQVKAFWTTQTKNQWTINWRFDSKKAKNWLNTYESQH